MPEASYDGVTWTPTWSVVCTHCGLLHNVPESGVSEVIDRHFARTHDTDDPGPQGLAWDAYESPFRCDTCTAVVEPPYWQHISTPPTNTESVVDWDGSWLLCDTCHRLHAAGKLMDWVRHYWSVAVVQTPLLLREKRLGSHVRATRAQSLALLLQRLDTGKRVQLIVKRPDQEPEE